MLQLLALPRVDAWALLWREWSSLSVCVFVCVCVWGLPNLEAGWVFLHKPGQDSSLSDLALERLWVMQSELLDLAEVDKRDQIEEREGAPHPSPVQEAERAPKVEGADIPESGLSKPKGEQVSQSEATSAKVSPPSSKAKKEKRKDKDKRKKHRAPSEARPDSGRAERKRHRSKDRSHSRSRRRRYQREKEAEANPPREHALEEEQRPEGSRK